MKRKRKRGGIEEGKGSFKERDQTLFLDLFVSFDDKKQREGEKCYKNTVVCFLRIEKKTEWIFV